MASLFFEDYHFPQELYNKDTGDFTTPIRTLLDFTPHILQELPKNTEDQKPIKSEDEDTYTNTTKTSSNWKSYLKSIVASERSKSLAEFVVRCGTEYLRASNERADFERFEREYQRDKKREERKRRREAEARRQRGGGWFNFYTSPESPISSSDDEEELEELLRKERRRRHREAEEENYSVPKEKRARTDEQAARQPQQQQTNQKQVIASSRTSAIAKSAAAASVLSLSLYSTYQASLTFSEVSFHNQLEILIDQVQSIIQSTDIWIDEHEKLGDPVPNRVRTDLVQIKQIVEYLIRLDPRSTKKMETAGWGCGAIGGLSALGGFALGSATVMTGGAALALGGAVMMISSKASSKSQLGARMLLENQVRERVSSCQKAVQERLKVINDFVTTSRVKTEPLRESRSFVNKQEKRVLEGTEGVHDEEPSQVRNSETRKKKIPAMTE